METVNICGLRSSKSSDNIYPYFLERDSKFDTTQYYHGAFSQVSEEFGTKGLLHQTFKPAVPLVR